MARIGEMRNACNMMTGKSDGTFGDLGVDVIFKKCVGVGGVDLSSAG